MAFHYQTSFTLDKAHYIECFQASAKPLRGIQPYYKALALFIAGLIVSSISQGNEQGHLAIFIIMLGVVEALSVRFRQTWWLWRQLISKAANSEVELTITEQNLEINGRYQKLTLAWQTLSEMVETEQGFVLTFNINQQLGKHYLTKSCLSEQAIAFVAARLPIDKQPS